MDGGEGGGLYVNGESVGREGGREGGFKMEGESDYSRGSGSPWYFIISVLIWASNSVARLRSNAKSSASFLA